MICARCSQALNLASEPFYYREMSQTPQMQDRPSCPVLIIFLGIVTFGIQGMGPLV